MQALVDPLSVDKETNGIEVLTEVSVHEGTKGLARFLSGCDRPIPASGDGHLLMAEYDVPPDVRFADRPRRVLSVATVGSATLTATLQHLTVKVLLMERPRAGLLLICAIVLADYIVGGIQF